jgi:DNA-directed RNA polymerase subunit M/transcription elongation factor TFIIS
MLSPEVKLLARKVPENMPELDAIIESVQVHNNLAISGFGTCPKCKQNTLIAVAQQMLHVDEVDADNSHLETVVVYHCIGCGLKKEVDMSRGPTE